MKNDTSSITEKCLALAAYLLVFLTALIGVWLFHKITPSALRALQQVSIEPEAMPYGFRLYLNLKPYFWLLPVIILIIGLLSWWFRFLRHSLALALFSSLVGLSFLAASMLLATPVFMHAGLPAISSEMVQELRAAKEITLLSLEPSSTPDGAKEKFHGYLVLGKVQISKPEQVEAVINSVIKGTENKWSSEALCFTPHHGLSIKSGSKTTDYLLCFQCNKLLYHPDGGYFSLNQSPRKLLNLTLQEAGVTLSASELSDDSPADVSKQGNE